jgi:ribokinase
MPSGIKIVPALKVEAVDTTGAGDAFTAALAFGLAEGRSLAEAVDLGTAAGAIAVTRFGTMPAMPTLREIEEFIKR